MRNLKFWAGRLALIFAALFCAYLSYRLAFNYYRDGKFANDFSVYWRASNQPLDDVYFWSGRFPFPYAPTMLLWIKPLGILPMWTAYFAFISVSLIVYVAAFRPYIGNLAMGLALISPPIARGFYTGQVCALLAGGILWACASKNRILAGILFGLIATIKPQLVAMAPMMLALNRDWRAFFSAGATFVALILLSAIAFGPERWPEWWASMEHFQRMVLDTNIKQIGSTLALWAENYHLPAMPMMILGLILGCAVVWFCRDAEPLEKCAAIVSASILAVPYALAYDLAPIIPLMALLAVKGRVVAAFGIAIPYHPFPLLAGTFELLADKFRAILRGESHAEMRV